MTGRSMLPLLMVLLFATLGVASARAASGPVYDVRASWGDTNLPPGGQGQGQFQLQVRNVGDAVEEKDLLVEDHLPAHVTATAISFDFFGQYDLSSFCSGVETETVTCLIPGGFLVGKGKLGGEAVPALGLPFPLITVQGYLPQIFIDVAVGPEASGWGTNTATVSGGGAAEPFTDEAQVPFRATPSPFGIREGSVEADFFDGAYPFGEPLRQAGAHPFEQRVNFELDQRSAVGPDGTRYTSPSGLARTIEATLPRGMLGNPEAVPKCQPSDFLKPSAEAGNTAPRSTGCPADTQVGFINIALVYGPESHGKRIVGGVEALNTNLTASHVPIYNMAPPKGVLADFAFSVGGVVQAHIYSRLDPAHDYAIETVAPDIASYLGIRMRASEVTIWGVPGDPAHDRFRYFSERQNNHEFVGAPFGTAAIRPLLTTPMDCGEENGGVLISADSYEHPGEFSPPVESHEPLDVTGCEDARFRFEPDISLEPTDRHAGAPTGLEVKLKVPQRNDEAKNAQELYAQNGDAKAIATPPIKKTVVTLPQGMTLNPSAGQGLGGCSLAQLGMSSSGVPNAEPVRCPEDSAIGTLILHSPELPVTEPLTGRVYIAKQGENPFGSIFALYLVLENKDRGELVKLAGKIELDPVTGQIKTTFDDLPQYHVSDFQLIFKGGIRAALVNPLTCGAKTITAEYYSWQDPNTPHVAADSYDVTQRPDGSPCVHDPAERPFAPQLSAGTTNPTGGAFSPFTLQLTRTDEDQEISTLGVTLPSGLIGKIAGVAQCPEAGIAQAKSREGVPGDGALEQADPSCPAASLVGSTLVGVGTGASLTWVPGKAYFAGPYKGAPFSLVVITPSVVGPYDLGTVALRNALYIDPLTAQVRVVSDPLPHILDGIPVRIRDVRVSIDRSQFMFNPTNCNEQQISSAIGSVEGASASPASRFQVANCATLAFKPSFQVSTSGRTSKINGAGLDARVSFPGGSMGSQANVAYVKVSLPKQLPSRLTTLQKACLASVFEANPAACPPGSVIGTARTSTPVLPVELTGPVYFVSHGGEAFPSLVVVLQGDGVTVDLTGTTFISKAGVTSTTFKTVPDVPFNTFELTLPQGPYSALAANGNLCALTKVVTVKKRVTVHSHGHTIHRLRKVKRRVAQSLVMPTEFIAQNGAQLHQNTKIAVTGCPKAKKPAKKAKKAAHKKKH
jgi:hypothetical protein